MKSPVLTLKIRKIASFNTEYLGCLRPLSYDMGRTSKKISAAAVYFFGRAPAYGSNCNKTSHCLGIWFFSVPSASIKRCQKKLETKIELTKFEQFEACNIFDLVFPIDYRPNLLYQIIALIFGYKRKSLRSLITFFGT